MSAPELSIVIPAYNEAGQITAAVVEARDRADALARPWEIIVVDNASTDGTPAELATLLSDDRIQLLRNEVNRGKGYSMRRGMLAARGQLRLHCDADCVGSFVSLPALLAAVDAGADVAVGSRLAPGAAVGRRQPLRRRVVGRAFVELCRLVLREPTHDLYCGFKLWRAAAAIDTYTGTRLDGWVFDAEVLAFARALGYEVREVGIAWSDRDGSRLSMPRVVVPAVRDLLRARRRAATAQASTRPEVAPRRAG
jgi:dolichyl-phosphate beta-glucosyltransferase